MGEGEGEDGEEEEDEPDQCERLRECDSQEHRGANHAGSLGLAGHRLDRRSGDEADTDARADGREAIADQGDRSLEFFHCLPFRFC